MTAWFTPGACATARDTRAQIISLYYAFAVDVLSDLMIMLLPVGLVWNLKLPRFKKAGIIALFCVGWIAIIAAVVRVVSIGVRAGTSTPSSTWLALWGTVESGIAVIIGTAPGLYTTARRVHTSRKESRYATYNKGYERHTGDVSNRTPEPLSKIDAPNASSSISHDDDESAFVHPLRQHTKSTSFSRPFSPKTSPAVTQHEVEEDIEMSPRDEWRQPQILVTKQFTVKSEKR